MYIAMRLCEICKAEQRREDISLFPDSLSSSSSGLKLGDIRTSSGMDAQNEQYFRSTSRIAMRGKHISNIISINPAFHVETRPKNQIECVKLIIHPIKPSGKNGSVHTDRQRKRLKNRQLLSHASKSAICFCSPLTSKECMYSYYCIIFYRIP